MSVSGTGPVGTPSYEPIEEPPADTTAETTSAETAAPARNPAAEALLGKLNDIARSSSPWLPSWLSFIDSDYNVVAGADEAIADGEVTGDEIVGLVRQAHDFGEMTGAEKNALKRMLHLHAAKIEPNARQALADFLGVENPLPVTPTAPTQPSEPTGPTGPTGPVQPAEPTEVKASDLVPAHILEKHGLDTEKLTTESTYDGAKWDVGYFPYTGDGQYQAFAKFANVYGHGAGDGHAYFEMYSNPPTDLARGSWIASGHISESNFERTAGVDITGDRPVNNALYKAIRESGVGNYDEIAVLDDSGKQVPFGEGDKLVPTVMRDGKPVEVGLGEGGYGTTWRIKHADGTLDTSAVPKDGEEVLGLSRSVSFDFLDASGRMVGFNPPRDRMVECFEGDDGKWHAFAKLEDGRFEHQVIDGDEIASSATIDQAAKDGLTSGRETMMRVQLAASGELKGDGKVGGDYNMGWWGKCHNVASIGTSDMPRPTQPVRVVNNLEAGEALALQYGNNVLKPAGDGSYVHQVRDDGGAVTSSRTIPADEATRLAEANDASAVIVRPDGSLKQAEVTHFDTEDVDALVSHIGDGAVVGKGGEGSRYYAHPDILVTKDGRQLQGHIKSVTTDSGATETIGRRKGTEFEESDRSPLRAPGMSSRVLGGGGRSYAFNIQDVGKLNEYRDDDIKSFTIVKEDGTEETIAAEELDLIAWENKFDFRPDMLWNLHETVNENGSTVSEMSAGTQVWNYTTRGVETTVLDPSKLSESEKEAAAKPGMMAGTIGDEDKHFFRTTLKTDGGTKDMTYWVRFDDEGEVSDYGYLSDDVPDFVWTQHVKDAFDERWSGESQAPGIRNDEIQRMYLASLGAFEDATLPGGFIARSDLDTAKAVRPEE